LKSGYPHAGEYLLVVFITLTAYLRVTMHSRPNGLGLVLALGANVLDVKMRRLMGVRKNLDARTTATWAAWARVARRFAPNALDRVE
jgi:hypothetical protein